MKAQDLRIGNLIYAPSGVEKYVFGTSYKTILYTSHLENSTYSEAYDYECEPIQLTEEWLLKFDKIDWISKDIKGVFFWFNGEKKYIKFVHSLQNTYFCIEQKELLCVNT